MMRLRREIEHLRRGNLLRSHLGRVSQSRMAAPQNSPPGVARLAEEFASAFNAGGWGRVAGIWHDLGKYSDAFQDYLGRGAGSDGDVHTSEVAGRIDHSTAGAQHAARLGPAGRLLAYGIAGHHAGLPD